MLLKLLIQTSAALVFVYTSLIVGKIIEKWSSKEIKRLGKNKEEVDTFIASISAIKDTFSLFMYKITFTILNKMTHYVDNKESLFIHFFGSAFGTFIFLITIKTTNKTLKNITNTM